MKITEINNKLKDLKIEELKPHLEVLKEDKRTGVINLLSKYEKKIKEYEKQVEEWSVKCEFDAVFHENKYVVVGIDEVGRGPLAGPVVAAAVILPYNIQLLGLKDSKKMTEVKREELYSQIQGAALAIGIGIVDAEIIDQVNILNATFKAMHLALEQLNYPYDLICVDGDKCIPHVDAVQHAIIAGDDKSACIAAASVIAKVTRDRMMKVYAKQYNGYDWESNKGYGSSKHYEAIKVFGITPLHRKSFLKKEGIF
jgi:ribonuclease HII